MSFLFDISPDEVPDDAKQKQKKQRRKTANVPEPAQRDGDHASSAIFAPQRRRNDTIIGRSAGHYECADSACGSTHFDILDEWRGEWFVECMVCGTGQNVPAVSGVIETPDDAGEFVFADGRYEGMSVSQVSRDQNGPKYIAWASENHKREAVRNACKKWIDSIPVGA